MTSRSQVYKCGKCGAMVEVLEGGTGTLVCCNEPMTLQEENTVDAAREKHVPVIEISDEGIKVSVGSVAHPMEESHYITWIELIVDERVHRRFLKPNDAPEAVFPVAGENIAARAYCNLHGLWKSEA